MPEDTETTRNDPEPADPGAPETDSTSDDDELAGLKNALAAEREKRRAAERLAKRAKGLETELAQLRDQTRSEADKQLAKATAGAAAKTRAEVREEMGARLARAELRSEAAGKVADIDAVIDDLDMTRYVGEDGEPDTRAIKQAVARFAKLAPAAQPVPPFNGGPRGSTTEVDMNTLIRRQAGLG